MLKLMSISVKLVSNYVARCSLRRPADTDTNTDALAADTQIQIHFKGASSERNSRYARIHKIRWQVQWKCTVRTTLKILFYIILFKFK